MKPTFYNLVQTQSWN